MHALLRGEVDGNGSNLLAKMATIEALDDKVA